MAGSGRRTNYRKSVQDDYLNGLPEPNDTLFVAQALGSRGSNIIEVLVDGGETGLAVLPSRFRKLIWVKRGDFVLISSSSGEIETCKGEGKVRHRIDNVLSKDQVKHIRKIGKWPAFFSNDTSVALEKVTQEMNDINISESDSYESSDNMEELFVNTNKVAMQRQRVHYDTSEDESESESESDGLGNGSESHIESRPA